MVTLALRKVDAAVVADFEMTVDPSLLFDIIHLLSAFSICVSNLLCENAPVLLSDDQQESTFIVEVKVAVGRSLLLFGLRQLHSPYFDSAVRRASHEQVRLRGELNKLDAGIFMDLKLA